MPKSLRWEPSSLMGKKVTQSLELPPKKELLNSMKVGSQLGSYIKTNYDIFGTVHEEANEELEVEERP